jgi:glycine dehydrogenase subunit 2
LPAKNAQGYYWEDAGPQSVGKVRANLGNFGVLVRAYAYIRFNGPDGLKHVSESAILNANYLKHELAPDYEAAYPQICQHEFVATARKQKEEHGVTATDIAKRLLDFGMYAPTVYFPLIVPEAMMIEPTETETRESLDAFVSAMHQIAEEARTNPEIVTTAPHTTVIGRLDQALAARKPNLRWKVGQEVTH